MRYFAFLIRIVRIQKTQRIYKASNDPDIYSLIEQTVCVTIIL
jgi:hypothetical protein